MSGFHFSYSRDGGPVACSCDIGGDHDAEDPRRNPPESRSVAGAVQPIRPAPVYGGSDVTSRGLNLHAFELHGIADMIEKMNRSGVRVEAAQIGQHRVTLEWHTDGQDAREVPYFTVTSIERVT